ncbi:MAG: KH domain-containing protein [Lentisphaeria bacterium]|nr:KH domain-containing protein [Lentisphaeria bacterium]
MELNQKDIESVRQNLDSVIRFLGLNAEVEAFAENDCLKLVVKSEEAGRIIGRKGRTLSSIQWLINSIMRKENEECPKLIISIDGYDDIMREERREQRRNRRNRKDNKSGNGNQRRRERENKKQDLAKAPAPVKEEKFEEPVIEEDDFDPENIEEFDMVDISELPGMEDEKSSNQKSQRRGRANDRRNNNRERRTNNRERHNKQEGPQNSNENWAPSDELKKETEEAPVSEEKVGVASVSDEKVEVTVVVEETAETKVEEPVVVAEEKTEVPVAEDKPKVDEEWERTRKQVITSIKEVRRWGDDTPVPPFEGKYLDQVKGIIKSEEGLELVEKGTNPSGKTKAVIQVK